MTTAEENVVTEVLKVNLAIFGVGFLFNVHGLFG